MSNVRVLNSDRVERTHIGCEQPTQWIASVDVLFSGVRGAYLEILCFNSLKERNPWQETEE